VTPFLPRRREGILNEEVGRWSKWRENKMDQSVEQGRSWHWIQFSELLREFNYLSWFLLLLFDLASHLNQKEMSVWKQWGKMALEASLKQSIIPPWIWPPTWTNRFRVLLSPGLGLPFFYWAISWWELVFSFQGQRLESVPFTCNVARHPSFGGCVHFYQIFLSFERENGEQRTVQRHLSPPFNVGLAIGSSAWRPWR
jgi:hypothetical protein